MRVAAAVPHVRVGDPAFNAQRTIELARGAPADADAALVLFPELGWPATRATTCSTSTSLTDAVIEAIERIVAASASLAR